MIKNSKTNNSLKQSQENVTIKPKVTSDEFDYDKLSHNYNAEHPRYSFEQVILPEKTQTKIEEAIGIIEVEEKVLMNGVCVLLSLMQHLHSAFMDLLEQANQWRLKRLHISLAKKS